MHNRGDQDQHVGNAGQVGQGDHLVAGQDEGQEDRDGNQDQSHGKGHGVAGAHGGVKANVDLAAVLEAGLDEVGSGLLDGHQALHQQRSHLGDQHHDGAHEDGHCQNARLAVLAGKNAVAGQDANEQANDGAQKNRLAKDAKPVLHGTNIDVDLVEAGNAVDDPVDGVGDGRVGAGKAVGDRDTGQAQGLLDQGSGDVADDQDDDLVDDCRRDAKHHIVGDDGHQGTREREVPVVPNVDVGGLGGVGDQHHDVDQQAQRNDDRAHDGAHGNGTGGGPAHVHDAQRQAKALDHCGHAGGQVGAHELVDDQVKANEANANGQTGLKALTKAGAKQNAQDGQDNGHHDRDAQARHAREERNNCVHNHSL